MVHSSTTRSLAILSILVLASISPLLTAGAVSGRSQTTWSGEITLNQHYTVAVTDELIISPCTNITMAFAKRIYVEGRLTIEGTSSCPVYLDNQGNGDHHGIQFNSSSNGRGSQLNNLSIIHSTYGITIYDSDPLLANITIYNPDDVGVDLFNSATPTIRNLVIDEAGQDWAFPAYWRYGIGLAVGANSAPNVDGLVVSDAVTRGLHLWGNAGGIFRNLTISNVSGATLAQSTGIWVNDSRPLIEHASVSKSDHGSIIRHIEDSQITRAVIRNMSISDSMYKGLIIDKEDHTNYTNYQSAVIEGLTIVGTGGNNAKTPGLGRATIEINATGAWIEDAILEDNDAVGIQLYFVDSSTTFLNTTINNTGGDDSGADGAGISIKSSYFAANFENLEISNSSTVGVHSSSGGAITGSNWNLHDNADSGLLINSAAAIIDDLTVANNGADGLYIYDSRYVFLSNVSSSGNTGSGFSFDRSNDIESNSGDVSCQNCTSVGDGLGLLVVDSVDLWLSGLNIHDPLSGPAIDIDNGGLNLGVQGGLFHISDSEVWINSSEPAVLIDKAEGQINGLVMNGNHKGIVWDADHNVERSSVMSNVQLSGNGCLTLSNHDQLSGIGNTITNGCTGQLNFQNVQLNWSGLSDQSNHVLNVDTNSHLHLHQPSNIDYNLANISGNGLIDEAWDVIVWVVNNQSNGVPYANVDLTFDQLESPISVSTDESGQSVILDLRGKRYASSGQSPYTTISFDCTYDGVSNTTAIQLDSDEIVWCHLPLENQAPFLFWDTPIDQEIFPSSAQVIFNANRSWDLDDDPLSFEWKSSIDGIFGTSEEVEVNDGTITEIPLSDGVHDITLEVCDDKGNCAQEVRTIELSNQPPIIVVTVVPALSPWSELITPITKPVSYSLNGSYDPEGDSLTCGWTWPGHYVQIGDCINGTGNLSFTDMTEMTFDLTLNISDGINSPSTWTVPVELFNEMPTADFIIEREANLSEDLVTLTYTGNDPEGDAIEFLWMSSLDGILSNTSTWAGYLSRGTHLLTLSVNDGRMEHLNTTSSNSSLIQVGNSPPKSMISGKDELQGHDSSYLFEFNSSGSGDWDSACSTFPLDIEWHCSADEPYSGSEWLVYSWESDVDGRLTEEGADWLIFETHLSSGTHNVTLTIDDGINPPAHDIVMIQVAPSAPVLGRILPDIEYGYHSSDTIFVDVSESIDYDGDNFTFDLYSDVTEQLLLDDANPEAVHSINLPAGNHNLEFNLTDSTGLYRVEIIQLTVVESDPQAVILTPSNNQFYAPGESIILDSNGTIDADGDITNREWRLHEVDTNWPTIISNSEYSVIHLLPGTHHISLYVEDRRGGTNELHVNITVGSSTPNLSNLSVKSKSYIVGELNTIEVSVELDDPDLTTNIVKASLTRDLQNWEFNLSDDNNDGIWSGELEFRPERVGKAQLKVTAIDGEFVDSQSLDVDIKEPEDNFSSLILIGGGIGGFILLSLIVVMVLVRRSRRLADIELIDNWGVFGNETKEIVDELLEETESV
ncbi:MAG: right-handed parallel beta-helix repeat-containing protein [Candidatus Poseidoniaceae archaeon]|jgi:hypothetical protein|nr:right-handed parallel beta-helix repeat-containing protein [Candidatus Poseidoniaceae archaeon]